MEEIIQFIQQNVDYAPYLIFFVLLLAGINIPVSEDAMLFLTALLATNHPEKLQILFLSIFFGAYISDMIAYSVGRFLGPKIWDIKIIATFLDRKMIDKLGDYYAKRGLVTLLIGRFIPFGVRNALFITAGLGKMNFKKFAMIDFIACLSSCSTYFFLYYKFGEDMIDFVKKSNLVIFSIFICFVIFILVKKKREKAATAQNSDSQE